MAKKSAKSKGYRKQTAKKPYLSKKEIVILCVLLVIIAIGAVVLFRYDDGALKVKDGAVVTGGDNWLIANGANARSRARYFKVGEVGDIEGYTRETSGALSDPNVFQYSYTPEDEAATITATITTSHSGAHALAEYASTAMAAIDGYEAGEVFDTEIDGATWSCFSYTSAYAVEDAEGEAEPAGDAEAQEAGDAESEEADAAEAEEASDAEAQETDAAEAEEAGDAETQAADGAEAEEAGDAEAQAPNRFEKGLNAYVDAAHDCCVLVHVRAEAPSAEEYPDDDAMMAVLEQAAAAVTLAE